MNEIIDKHYVLYTYLNAFWRRRFLIITCIVITPFFALLSAQLLPQKYQASISIAINQIQTPSLKDVSNSITTSQQFAGVKAYISSPNVLEKSIIETKLIPANSSGKLIQQTANDLKNKLKITLVGDDVIQIDLVQNSPNYLSSILTNLGNKLIEQLNIQNSNLTQSYVKVIGSELKKQDEITSQSINNLNQYLETHAELAPIYRATYSKRLAEIISQLGDNKIKYNTLIIEQNALYKLITKMNPQLGLIENAILENENQLLSMRLIYTDNFPGVQALLQRREALNVERDKLNKQYQNINYNLQTLWNLVITSSNNQGNQRFQMLSSQLEKLRDIQLKVQGLVVEIKSLNSQQNEINKKLRLMDSTSITITKLGQIVKNNQNTYTEMLNRYNLLKTTMNLNNANGSRIAQIVAFPQKTIDSLARPLYFFFILGIFSGIFLGFALAIILEFMDNTVRSRRDMEAIDHLKVICRVNNLA